MKAPKLLIAVGTLLLLLAVGTLVVTGQGGEETPIVTTASRAVGVGTYVAAEAYGLPAGADPAEQPAQAIILPYGIYPAMGLMAIEDFQQPESAAPGFTFAWSLTPAEDSSATLLADGVVAIFMADVPGQYSLTLTATDANGNTGEKTWVVTASNYVGNGFLHPDKARDECLECHDDKLEGWSSTGHAIALSAGLDGEYDHFGPSCVSCHSTGYNTMATAVNDGFDDRAAAAGWTFPETLEPGNWDAMVAEFPDVAALANVQCEACHGPGEAHIFDSSRRDRMISTGLEYGVCAQCHAEEPYNLIPQQWELSGHADKNAMAFTYPIGEEEAECVRCHSGAGYIDYLNGVSVEDTRTNYQVITCAVCHDPHDGSNPSQLRVFDSVTLPDGLEVAEAGPAATCMGCHNSRVDPVASVEGAASGGYFSTPHYSTAAELMNATGGYTWGLTLPTSTHGRVVDDSCISCHMANSPDQDTVGGHTFAMVSPVDGAENVAVCQHCHDGATSFAFEARRDYDGDGVIETNQDEVAGLRELLAGALTEQGVGILDHYPYFTLPEGAGADLYGAVYNFKFTASGGTAVHNLRYVVSLLQLSYERLTGEPVPNAVILAPAM